MHGLELVDRCGRGRALGFLLRSLAIERRELGALLGRLADQEAAAASAISAAARASAAA